MANRLGRLLLLAALAEALVAPPRAGWAARRPRAARAPPRASATAAEESLTLSPIGRISGEVELPGSKSLSNRVLLLAALSEGVTTVENLLDSDDIRYMLGALEALGVPVECDVAARRCVITGRGGPLDAPGLGAGEAAELFLGNAGTAMRPLAAVLGAGRGSFVLDGTPRMRERPIGDLVDGMRQLGIDATCSDTACPPVRLESAGLKAGGVARVSGQISSQYLSALLMMAPLAEGEGETVIEITDELVSAPYVYMTIKLMAKFGVTVEASADDKRFVVPAGQKYVTPGVVPVEGDASSASYFLGGAAITGGPVTVVGCGDESVQGDVGFARVLEQMGATVEWSANSITVSRDPSGAPLRGVDVDCGEIPDAAMTLAVIALFAEGPTAIRNVYNWRVKETERMVAIVTELRKLGAEVEEGRDYCIVQPLASLKSGVAIDTCARARARRASMTRTRRDTVAFAVSPRSYDDHRMAMCFSLAACGGVDVIINDPKCTSKTFPTYFDVLGGLSK